MKKQKLKEKQNYVNITKIVKNNLVNLLINLYINKNKFSNKIVKVKIKSKIKNSNNMKEPQIYTPKFRVIT